ncbi:carboxylesterase 5A [Strongylocentrotus purpuratus]|uniref:Carboxylic ester hydrolase n=1 Tax=Strongylocentrotus purpuratus TaxID=7668 RepID=A0A7M7N041_STRPU|nr:carboxylesterase 5A [Strongylocentrotus purpuratus]XP_030828983.1 carboxylesterase 5A [Strongylocentrotus purpuratus]XP_030828984.1 carboxylesterase 5A [Strongylocentrotus purpuratus]
MDTHSWPGSWSLLVLLLIVVSRCESVTVDVTGGRLVGQTIPFDQEFLGITTNVDVYLGVPFAEPPVRFAAPVSKEPWEGDWNATYFRDTCSQVVTDPLQMPASEDCLYLNVFAPNPMPANAAVMVYFPGGAFKFGGASNPNYAGVSLAASSDVIIVTVGYRVSVFGIFSTGDEVAPGNYAMLDQVAALQWVHYNIEAFGGNKEKVTIFGQSSGAGSVGFHLLSKLSAGFFSQAILQSGSALSPRYFRNNPEEDRRDAMELASAVGCPSTDSTALVTCLRTVDEMTLLQVQDSVYQSGYFIRLDGTFLEDTPDNLLYGEDSIPLPTAIMAGFNSQEGTASIRSFFPEYSTRETGPFINRSMFKTMVHSSLLGSDKHSLIRESVYQEYVDWSRVDYDDLDYFDAYVPFYSDYIWRSGSDASVRRYYELGVANIYQYYFTHTPSSSFSRAGPVNPTWLGAGHTEEFQFVFGWSFDENILQYKHELTDDEKMLSAQMMKMWTNFAKSGNPTRESPDSSPDPDLPVWSPYTIPELNYLEIRLNNSITERAVQACGMAFWNRYIPELRMFLESLSDGEEEWKEDFADWQQEMDEWRLAFKDYQEQTTCP